MKNSAVFAFALVFLFLASVSRADDTYLLSCSTVETVTADDGSTLYGCATAPVLVDASSISAQSGFLYQFENLDAEDAANIVMAVVAIWGIAWGFRQLIKMSG